jgi:hypothetical protein
MLQTISKKSPSSGCTSSSNAYCDRAAVQISPTSGEITKIDGFQANLYDKEGV